MGACLSNPIVTVKETSVITTIEDVEIYDTDVEDEDNNVSKKIINLSNSMSKSSKERLTKIMNNLGKI
jgi:hypothetical protein